jgi:hypothetical protein
MIAVIIVLAGMLIVGGGAQLEAERRREEPTPVVEQSPPKPRAQPRSVVRVRLAPAPSSLTRFELRTSRL